MKLGSLDIVEGWRDADGQTEVYKFVTVPDLDAYVPQPLQKHFLKGAFQYVDIIRYDPRHITCSPFQLYVSSIPPILPDQVLCSTASLPLVHAFSHVSTDRYNDVVLTN